MNEHRIEGKVQEIMGNAKKATGDVLGDESLSIEGSVDKVVGSAKQALGSALDAAAPVVETLREKAAPVVDKTRSFAKQNPWALAAFLSVVGIALLRSFRRSAK